MDSKVNERIKAQYEETGSSAKSFDVEADDISGYIVYMKNVSCISRDYVFILQLK